MADDVTGTVTAFDDPAGFGTVTTDEGGEHFFHCTAITDGTRQIAVGARGRPRIGPGRLGRWEAATVRPLYPV